MTQNSNIFEQLAQLGRSVSTKSAYIKGSETKGKGTPDPDKQKTTHPVGDVEDPTETPVQEGEFAAKNTADSKDNAGPLGVDNQPDSHPVKEKMHDKENQSDLKTSQAEDPPPSEIKPTKTVAHGDTDTDTGSLGGNEAADREEEPTGDVGGVGGPDFSQTSKAAAWLQKVSAFIPKLEEGEKTAKAADKTEAEPEEKPEVEDKTDTEENLVTADEAADLVAAEKAAKAIIDQALQSCRLPKEATVDQAREALIRLYADNAVKYAHGFLVSTDESLLKSLRNGTFHSTVQKRAAGDPMAGGMPMGDPMGGGDPMGDPMAGGAPAGDPMGGGEDPIMLVLQALESGEISPEEAVQALLALGLSEEEIMEIFGEPGAGGAPAPGGEGAPAPAPVA